MSKDSFWSNAAETVGGLWETEQKNKTAQSVAASNASAISSTVKFIGIGLVIAIVFKSLFKK